jgi:tRNA nucleotidyltransferase/poly(A) polymerase
MGRLSAERVKQELEKTMEQARNPSRALALWKSTGLLGTVIPQLAGVDDSTLRALDLLPMPGAPTKPYRLFARVAALFTELGEAGVRAALTALRFPGADIRRAAKIAATWTSIGATIGDALAGAHIADAEVRRMVAKIGRLDLAPFMRVAGALWQARREGDATLLSQLRSLYRRMLRVAQKDPISVADLAIDGDDLRMMGIPPGPLVGRILQVLLDAVLDDPTRNTRDVLLAEGVRLANETRMSS